MSYTFRAIVGADQFDLPDWQKCSLGYDFSDAGVFSGDYVTDGVNANLVDDGAIIVALWNGTENFDSRFRITAGSGEDDTESLVNKVTGLSIMDLFRRVVVEEIAAKPGENIKFVTSNAGAILINLLTAAQGRGAATGITWDFTNVVDSNGDPWDKVLPDIEYKLGIKYLDIIRNLVDQGMVEVRFDGYKLQAFNADAMGSDLADTVELRSGLDYEEAPRKWSSENLAKFSMTVGDEGIIVRKTDASIPDGPFGREEQAVSQGGTKDVGTLTLVNDAAMEKVKQKREQLTRKVVIREDGPIPGVDYRVSDYISERITGPDGTSTSNRYRVRSLVVDLDGSGELGEASIVLNDKFLEQEIRTARRVNGIIGGASADGGGNGLPVQDKPDTTTPSKPTALTIDSDAYLDANGDVRSLMILDWVAPATNTDGSAIADLKEYEVQYRVVGAALWRTAPRYTTDYATISGMDPEVTMEVRVRAWDNSSHVSDWSATASAVMDNDTIPPPVPSTPTGQSYLGAIILTWDGKGVGGALMPDDYAGCRVHVSTVNDFDPDATNVSQTFLFKNRVGSTSVSGLTYGVQHYIKLVAYDRHGNASEPSEQIAVIPRRVVEDDIEPGAITTGVVDFDARDLGAQETFFGPVAPPSPNADDLWVDEAHNNQLMRWDGDSWNPVSDTRIAQNILDIEQAAQDAQDAYDAASAKATVYYQASAPTGLGALDVNDLWIDSDDNQKVYRWIGSSWSLTNIASTDYIASRATDLVTNGTGALGNNTNFSGFLVDATDAPIGSALSFDADPPAVSATEPIDEYLPVDTSKKYKFSFQAKQKGSTAGGYMYSGVRAYDAYKGDIQPQYVMYQPGTLTTLAVQLNPGDTTITIAAPATPFYGSAGKNAGASTHFRSIIWWDYVDAGGKLWEPETYSRNWSGSDYWSDGGVVGNVITLKAPYAGPVRPVGTKLSNGSSGGTYMYGGIVNAIVPKIWTPYSATITGVASGGVPPSFLTGWPYGTAYAKIIWLTNRTSVGGNEANSRHSVASVSFSDASAAQQTADLKTTVFSQTSQPTTAGRTNGDMWYDTDDGNQLYIWTGSAWTASDLGVQAINFTARDIGAVTTFWQVSQPTGAKIGDMWFDTDDKNKSYRYNGSTWDVTRDQTIADALTAAAGAQSTADGKIKTFAQDAPPVATGDGDLWVDTNDSRKLYRWNLATTAWVLVDDARIAANVAAIAALQTNLANAVSATATARAIADGLVDTFYQTTPPTVGVSEGDLWVDTDDSNKSYRRSASATWVLITDDRVSKALSDAASASASADGKITSYYQASPPTSMTDSNAGDLWFDTDDSNRAYWYRPSTLGVAGWVAMPFGGNAIAPGSLSMSNMVSEIRSSLGQLFFDDFSDVSRWLRAGGAGTFVSAAVADSQSGGSVGRSTSYSYLYHSTMIPFDPNETYRVSARFRANPDTAGEIVYMGVRGLDSNGAYVANYYVACSAQEAVGAWTNVVGYVKGTAAVATASTPKPDVKAPGTVGTTVRYLQPIMLLNYNDTTGKITEVDVFKVEVLPTGLVDRVNIALAAINAVLIEDAAIINAKIANLAVTNAKINDVAANKVTTAELAAGVRVIAGPEMGTHAELTATGFRSFIEDPVDGVPNEVVRIGTNDNDIFAISDSAGNVLAAIDDEGKINARGASIGDGSGPVWYTDPVDGSKSLTEGVEIYGNEFMTYFDRLPKGNIAFSYRGDASAYTSTEQPYIQLDATLESGRLYHFHAKGIASNNTAGARAIAVIRYRRDNGAAQLGDPPLQYWRMPTATSGGQVYPFNLSHGYSTGVYDGSTYEMSLLLCVYPEGGGSVRFPSAGSDPTYFWIDDMGIYNGDTGIDRQGGTTPPPTKKTYVTTWNSLDGITYQGDGSKRTDTSDVVQGYNSYNGDGKGLWTFPSFTSILSGSTVNKVEIYAYAGHWYYNSGGTALIKVHGYSSAPASSPAMTTATTSSGWPKPGGRWVTLPSSLYAGFKSGAYKGFGVGPAGSTNLLYYGRFSGNTNAQVRITYTK